MENTVLFLLQRETYFRDDFFQGDFLSMVLFKRLFSLYFYCNKCHKQYYILILSIKNSDKCIYDLK